MEQRVPPNFSIDEIQCRRMSDTDDLKCITTQSGSFCSNAPLPDGGDLIALPYDDAFKGRREKCYQITYDGMQDGMPVAYVMSRSVRGVSKTIQEGASLQNRVMQTRELVKINEKLSSVNNHLSSNIYDPMTKDSGREFWLGGGDDSD